MTRADFIDAAEIVKKANLYHRKALALAFCELFSKRNNLFDMGRFMTACGL